MKPVTIIAENVNDAYRQGLELFSGEALSHGSRAGTTARMPGPVITMTKSPRDRVLMDPHRDANPFFHLMEAIWMLAGRNDVKFLTTYNKRMAEFSDDGRRFHGAYGHRWRHHFGDSEQPDIDQLAKVVQTLREQPETRRAVVAMWDPEADMGRAMHGGLDVPCNTQIYFSIREGALLMQVVCRSNDMVWGAYGANAVHFSVLQEWVAASLGVPMGPMYQLSFDFHMYQRHFGLVQKARVSGVMDPYSADASPELRIASVPMVESPDAFLHECEQFCKYPLLGAADWENRWLVNTAGTMAHSWELFKQGNIGAALQAARQIEAPDWSSACEQWLLRRQK